MRSVEFRILGPLEVWHDGQLIPVSGGKQRAILAVLLLHAGEVVSTDRLIDALWGDEPPEAGATALLTFGETEMLTRALEPWRRLGDSSACSSPPPDRDTTD